MLDHGRVPGRWPLVGRDEELARFVGAMNRRELRAFLIHGPAGVGKTRLADECLATAERNGRTTARAIATRTAAGIPLSAVAHLLALDDLGTQDLDPVLLFDRARRSVQARAAGQLVLFIDDLPALDPVSLVLLSQLVEVGLVFLIATVRTGEPVPDAVAPLWAADRSVRVDLDNLPRDAVDAILETVLGGPVTVASLAEIYQACQGNVLYLHELVMGAIAQGALAEEGGVWRLTRPLGGTPRLLELIEDRVRSVDDSGREILERLALCQPIGLDDLQHITELAILDQLEAAGLIELTVSRRRHEVTLAHPLHAQSLRAGLSRIRHRMLLLDQVGRIEGHGARRREDPLQVATWRLAATGTADPQLLVRAARLARFGHDFARVEEFSRAALAEQRSAEAALMLGEALLQRGQFAEAEAALQTAAELTAEPAQLLPIALTRAANLDWGLLDPDQAFRVLDDAHERLPEPLHAELNAMRATILAFRDRPAAALAALGSAATEPTPLRSLSTATALAGSGRTQDAIRIAEVGYATAKAGGPEFTLLHPAVQLLSLAIALHEAGRLAEAARVLTDALDDVVADDVAHAMSMDLWHLGRHLLAQGRPRTAARWCRDAVSLARSRGFGLSLKMGLAVLATALSHLGDIEGARVAIAELSTIAPTVDALGAVAQARAWSTAATDDPAQARQGLLDAAAETISHGQRTTAAALLHDVARLGDARAVVGRLAELAAACDSPLVSARASYARGVATRDAGLLDQVADQFEEMGAVLFAAEAAASAADCWRAEGDQRRAAASLGRAGALSERCEGARTPPLTTTDSVSPLTPREREICVLAATGLSSRQIAERLFLSVRTVNNHLQNAYLKLGVGGRRELAEALQLAA